MQEKTREQAADGLYTQNPRCAAFDGNKTPTQAAQAKGAARAKTSAKGRVFVADDPRHLARHLADYLVVYVAPRLGWRRWFGALGWLVRLAIARNGRPA